MSSLRQWRGGVYFSFFCMVEIWIFIKPRLISTLPPKYYFRFISHVGYTLFLESVHSIFIPDLTPSRPAGVGLSAAPRTSGPRLRVRRTSTWSSSSLTGRTAPSTWWSTRRPSSDTRSRRSTSRILSLEIRLVWFFLQHSLCSSFRSNFNYPKEMPHHFFY